MKLKSLGEAGRIPHRPARPRGRRRLRTIAMLPTLLTLGSVYFGFAAIYCCGREMEDLGAGIRATEVRTLNNQFMEARAPSYLSIAAWMVLAAMICDALDGRIARRTGRTSRFGEQLDSLADIVSFGAAPALMMVTMSRRELTQWGSLGSYQLGQVAVLVGVIYLCCAALRLARFTVEATAEEAKHEGFRGLPAPGAAGGVVSIIFLHDHLVVDRVWPRTADVLAWALPVCTILIALLMVSRIPFTHVVSSFLRRRPFGHVIALLLPVPFIVLYPEQVAVGLAWSFIASGPVRLAWRKMKGRPPRPELGVEQGDELDSSAVRKEA